MNSQHAEVDTQYVSSIESPAVFLLDEKIVIFYGIHRKLLVFVSASNGFYKLSLDSFKEIAGSRLKFLLPRRTAATPTTRFGWSWFTPLLSKYKVALGLVFIASLLSQLFGLAIPLLLQQIIDKVLSQGNLSSLNVLGAAMVLMALFQGILNILRSYIFVDTTDRMDLPWRSGDRLLLS